MIRLGRTFFLFALILGVAAGAYAQAPPIPQPGPEHEILKRDVGTWDVALEINIGPGMPPFTMAGVETATMVSGRWLVSEFKSEMMGQPFESRGISGWDPDKKAYVSVAADTMSTSLTPSESTYDAATNTMTGWSEMRDPMGNKAKAKIVVTWPAPDTRVVKVFMNPSDPQPFMTLTYKKRK
jgi:hypothetical protein